MLGEHPLHSGDIVAHFVFPSQLQRAGELVETLPGNKLLKMWIHVVFYRTEMKGCPFPEKNISIYEFFENLTKVWAPSCTATCRGQQSRWNSHPIASSSTEFENFERSFFIQEKYLGKSVTIHQRAHQFNIALAQLERHFELFAWQGIPENQRSFVRVAAILTFYSSAEPRCFQSWCCRHGIGRTEKIEFVFFG